MTSPARFTKTRRNKGKRWTTAAKCLAASPAKKLETCLMISPAKSCKNMDPGKAIYSVFHQRARHLCFLLSADVLCGIPLSLAVKAF